ncbi:MAG: hypothetical protein ACRDBH_10295 [Bosea sp. (in: a-proteobacteria)]
MSGLTTNPRSLVFGFIAGAIAVITFHQSMVLILHLLKYLPNFPWSFRPTGAWGVPMLLNSVFWGGLWGMVFAALLAFIPGRTLWQRGLIFGWLGPLLTGNWLLVPFFKGGPYFGGFVTQRMIISLLIASAFGFGLALFYRMLQKRA